MGTSSANYDQLRFSFPVATDGNVGSLCHLKLSATGYNILNIILKNHIKHHYNIIKHHIENLQKQHLVILYLKSYLVNDTFPRHLEIRIGFHVLVASTGRWLLMENPIKMDDLGVPPILGNLHILSPIQRYQKYHLDLLGGLGIDTILRQSPNEFLGTSVGCCSAAVPKLAAQFRFVDFNLIPQRPEECLQIPRG